MSDSQKALKRKLVKLAYNKPELREHVLPLFQDDNSFEKKSASALKANLEWSDLNKTISKYRGSVDRHYVEIHGKGLYCRMAIVFEDDSSSFNAFDALVELINKSPYRDQGTARNGKKVVLEFILE